MRRKTCSECERELPKGAWSCPYCGNPGEPTASRQIGAQISTKGGMMLVVLFIIFPAVLLLVHFFVPGM